MNAIIVDRRIQTALSTNFLPGADWSYKAGDKILLFSEDKKG